MAFYPDKKINNSLFTYKRKKLSQERHQNKQLNKTPNNQIFAAWDKDWSVTKYLAIGHCGNALRGWRTQFPVCQGSKTTQLEVTKFKVRNCWWHFCDKTSMYLGGNDRLRGIVRTSHIYRGQRSLKIINLLKLFQIPTSKLLFSYRGSSISFVSKMAVPWRSFFSCFFLNPQQLSDPDCCRCFRSSGMALGIFSCL